MDVAARLAAAGFLAAREEADELIGAAAGDRAALAALTERRLRGEPLAWITGSVAFAGLTVAVHPGVYVPRPHTEALAERAAAHLSANAAAVDVCTGSGALALLLATAWPTARVIGTDLDPVAVACARANGVEAVCGDLLDPVPADLDGRVDVVAGVVPYVPTPALPLLQRDTFAFESTLAYDGGPDGTALAARVVAGAPRLLRPGGWLVLEVGGDEVGLLRPGLAAAGFAPPDVLTDEEGDVRGFAARFGPPAPRSPSIAPPA